MADLLLNIIGTDGASAALRSVGISFTELTKLAADCTKQFEEQAKADRQLERYAGDLTGAFKAQASAMQETLGVSDDMVEQMQTMLLRFGEAPDQVEATTRALLDYSAATGTDAVAATQQLLTSVNSGKAAFKDLGLVYEQTGYKSADLVAVTNALAGKVGGSAKAEAGSLSGQTRIAIEAVNEFKESVGGLISEFVNKTGAVGTFTAAIKDLQVLLFGAQKDSLVGLQQNIDAAKEKLVSMQAGWRDALTFVSAGAFEGYTKEEVDAQIKLIKSLEAEWATANAARQRALGGDEVVGLTGIHKDELTNKGKKTAEKEANDRKLSDFESYAEARTKADFDFADNQKKALDQLAEDRTKAQIDDQARYLKDEEDEEKHYEKRRNNLAEAVDYELDMAEKARKEVDKADKKLAQQEEKNAKELQEKMEKFGAAVGEAFGHALSQAIVAAIEADQDTDIEGAAIDIGFALAAAVGTAIGSIYNPAIGSAIGAGIAGAGQIASAVHKKGMKDAKGRTHHDGGWIGEYHSGGWPGAASDEEMAILQRGERVLSRSEVARMGGPAGVESSARGRGRGDTYYVSTLDSRSFEDYLGGRGGRSVYNASRIGRGSLPLALGES